MMYAASSFVFSILVATALANPANVVAQIGDCRSSVDCDQGSCCVVGLNRYSMPWCQPLRQLGEQCRPASQPQNITLWYPSGVTIELYDSYQVLCPCDANLHCDVHEGLCSASWDIQEPTSVEEENAINNV